MRRSVQLLLEDRALPHECVTCNENYATPEATFESLLKNPAHGGVEPETLAKRLRHVECL